MNDQTMNLSSPRKAVSTSVVDADSNNCMKEEPTNNLLIDNPGIDVPFGASGEEQNPNLIGDSIYIKDDPQAAVITETEEKYILTSKEEEMEKSSTHSQDNISKCSSKSSNIGTQTFLKGIALNMTAMKRSESLGHQSFSIREKSPPKIWNEIDYSLHKGQALPYPLGALPNAMTTIAKLETKKTSFCRTIMRDIRGIVSIFSTVAILFWILSMYFEKNVISEFFNYILYKIRIWSVIPDPPKTKFQGFTDLIAKIFT